MLSAATVITKERSENPSYTFEDFIQETKIPSILRKAVEKLAADPDLKLVSLHVRVQLF